MSILSVDTISPIGSGTTVTLNATETKVNNFITVGTGASISSPSSNVLTLGTNSTERLRITSSGNVNIGGDYTQTSRFVNINGGSTVGQLQLKGTEADIWLHSTGANGQWRILGSSGNTTHAFRIYDQTNSAERLRIKATGEVGIGTDNPSQTLHILSDGNALIRLESTDANAGVQFVDPDTGAKPPLIYGVGDDFTIWTDWTERFRVKLDGKIGIGTTNPERTMDVKGSNCMVQLEGTGGSGKQWSLCSADNTTGAAVGTAGMFAIYNDTDGVAALRVSNSNYVLRPKLPYFYATATPTAGSPNIHSFGNVHGNNGNHYNNSNGRFTAPVDGFYWFAAGIWCNSANNQTGAHLQLMRYIQSSSSTSAFAGANHVTQYNQLPLSGGTFMTSGDYVYLHQTGIAIQGSTPRNYFSGYLVG